MTTSTISLRRVHSTAAATALVGILMATTLNSAYAMPGPDDQPTASGHDHTDGHYVWHACFLTPRTWNKASAGPLPLCYLHVA